MSAMTDESPVNEAFDRLHQAGWSVGDVALAQGWLVTGSNGENQMQASGMTQAEAWRLACEQAMALGMLAAADGTTLALPARLRPGS
jgi:phospholipase/lecithinase/hemolysin